ncbi:amino acid adenylation domain-containing protein [Amycolatopsis marina]|uniref:Amino acid adenylation domain-containing protein n=1 Tax=Amycolatopsis marina TaxID=490629 RepID=A0A1I1B6A7_9PSEU|nr:AMP-binding protein [Amycolatopsis marina]SFB44073.1 amino acid adenylation domain-containing protein [Amycolatopsis marina]
MSRSDIVRRFTDTAEYAPHRIAVATDTGDVTYARLAELAGGRARLLRTAGALPGTRVGLLTGHGTASIAAVLGTLAAGCVYVPLDPGFPVDRLQYQLATANVSLVLAAPEHAELAEALCRHTARRLVLADDHHLAALPSASGQDLDELAYVLFTSGSTGRPKAVGQTRRNLLHVVDNQIDSLSITVADRLSLLASFAFDAAIPDLYPALLTGAAVVPVDVRAHGVAHTARVLARHGVTIYHSTPTVYRYLLDVLGEDRLASVRTVLLGGEQATYDDVRAGVARFGPECVFVNGYGATEVTFAAQYRLPVTEFDAAASRGPLPIGSALPGFELALREDSGEIEIRGRHLVQGYLDQSDRPDGQSPGFGVTADGVRRYRTGDVGRRLPDGELVCLGRLDRQVKLRGFRVEPAEVEACLSALPGVAQARVIVRDDVLLGYVTAAADTHHPQPTLLRAELARRLPGYSVPAAVTVVGEFPLTVTGKLDERALPDPRAEMAGTGFGAPTTGTERQVHDIWCAVLGRDVVAVSDNFFDVGGHSLLLGRVQQRLTERFGVDIPLLRLFEHPTITAQAEYLDGAVSGTVGDSATSAAEVAQAPAHRVPPVEPAEVNSDLIAVVGLGGCFPGARNVASFWWNLCAGVDSIHDYSDKELAELGIGVGLRSDPAHVRSGGRLDGVEDFDAEFFGFSAEEAALADPQHRLFLEAAWQALEDAGRDPAEEEGPVGVFASSSVNRYFLYHLFDNPAVTGVLDPDEWETRLLERQLTDHLPGQVAYRLGLTGPALAVQSACSSSLAAVCLAAQNLADYRCDLALAGGVSVTWPRHRRGALTSVDGRCRAFDAAADGSGFSSGAGVVALRRLADALADGDHVYAVLPGWAMTNDGADRAGYAVPGTAGQSAAVAEALAVAQVDPVEVRLVEAHGSGTPLGDAIEVSALNRVFGHSAPQGWCALGSVKTNIGHLDAAAGVAGLIKAVLAVRHGVIPPNLHFTTPHPEVDLTGGPFYVPTKPLEWPVGEPRVAGVSAFGMGGTNVHVVVREAPPGGVAVPAIGPYLLPMSARDSTALRAVVSRLRDHLVAGSPELADVAYTLAVGRRALRCRAAVVAESRDAAVTALDVLLDDDTDLAGQQGELLELGARWVAGADVDWRAHYEGRSGRRIPLPTYPFQRTRFWIDPPLKGGPR